ncbi:MAG: sulfurtransferase-like selenium metabolism protein YedF [Coriobacteriia bacterium]|nr:sulfurtransferase-like selenium metabolism protein YedF [Coriobacteriia bacterium]
MKKYLMINSESLGQGDYELGKTLMKKFLHTAVASGETPEGIALLNSGVKLACEGSPVLDELRSFEERGAKISSCITCLEFYDLLDKVAVGIQGTMSLYVQYMFDADDTFVIG